MKPRPAGASARVRSRPTRVLVAVEEPLFCAGVTRLLETAPGLRLVGQTCDGERVVRLCRELTPDVLLLDASLRQGAVLEMLSQLAAEARPPATLLLVSTVSLALTSQALRLGGRGVLLKRSPPALVLQAIRAAASGRRWIGRELAASLLDQAGVENRRAVADPLERLTPRERQVVGAVITGVPNREIAARLALSEETVKHNLTRIFAKLNIRSRTGLVAWLAGTRALAASKKQ